MWWKAKQDGSWLLFIGGWMSNESRFRPATPIGEEADWLKLLQCVPPGTTLPGVGKRGENQMFRTEEAGYEMG